MCGNPAACHGAQGLRRGGMQTCHSRKAAFLLTRQPYLKSVPHVLQCTRSAWRRHACVSSSAPPRETLQSPSLSSLASSLLWPPSLAPTRWPGRQSEARPGRQILTTRLTRLPLYPGHRDKVRHACQSYSDGIRVDRIRVLRVSRLRFDDFMIEKRGWRSDDFVIQIGEDGNKSLHTLSPKSNLFSSVL